MKSYFFVAIAVCSLAISCKKSTVTPDFSNQLLNIYEHQLSGGSTLHLFSFDTLRTGYNEMFIQVKKNGTVQRDNDIKLLPLMNMGTMSHSSPYNGPVFDPSRQMYEAAVVFTMPSTSGSWTLRVAVDNEEAIIPLNVKPEKNKTVGTFSGSDDEHYVVAMYPKEGFRVGMNPFSLFVTRMEDHTKFSPVEGLSVEFYPEMTSMGHSSPNNVNPVDSRRGYYNGSANFTMSGDWKLHFRLKSGSTVLIDDAAMDIVF